MDALYQIKHNPAEAKGNIVFLNLTATLVGVALGWIGYQVTAPSIRLTPFWPLSGLALVLWFCHGRKVLPAVFLSVFVVTGILTDRPLWMCGLMALGNTVEPIVGVALVRAMRRAGAQFGAFGDALTIGVAGFLSPIPSAVIGGTLVAWLRGSDITETLHGVATWWTGHFIGILVITPFIAAWLARPRFSRKQWSRFILLAVILASVGAFVFWHPNGAYALFFLFPILLLASCWLPDALLFLLALGLQGLALATFLQGGSLYHTGGPFEDVFNLQVFFVTLGLTTLFLTGFRLRSLFQAPALALLAGWTFSGILFALVTADGVASDHERFKSLVRNAERDIQLSFNAYTDTMRAVAGFVSGSGDVDRLGWLQFMKYLDWERRSPGLLGIGFVNIVDPAGIHAFERQMRARGYPNFKIYAPGPTDPSDIEEHLVLTFVAPEARNMNALGMDLALEPKRRAAADRARATGEAVLSSEVTPISYPPYAQNYALLLPFFHHDKGGQTGKLAGYIYSPFQPERFFQGVLKSDPQIHAEVFRDLFSSRDRVYRSVGEPLRRRIDYEVKSTFVLGGQPFQVGWRRAATFQTSLDFVTVLLSCTGALLSLAFAGLVRKLELAGRDARLLARQKTAELAQRDHQVAEQASMLTRIMNSVPVGIFRADDKGLLVLCNEEWGDITERSPVRSQGTHWLTPFHRDDREGLAALLAEAMGRRAQVQGEFRVTRPKGEVRAVQVILVAETNQERSDIGFLGTIQDQTDYKAAQEVFEMQRAMVAHSAKMASLGEMAGGIAHEINNPLAIIHGKTRQMRRMFETDDAEQRAVQDALETIERTTMRISKIIKGLRAFSRSGEHDPFVRESLPAIVEQTLDLCRERFKNAGVDLRVGPIPAVQIECRGTQVEQVLMNLLSNAFDAVHDRPERWVSLSAKEGDARVEICVTDSGLGIASHMREKIFQPFFTTKEIGLGTGLGLSIARGIMADHGGRLYVDEHCRHTRFVMELKASSRL